MLFQRELLKQIKEDYGIMRESIYSRIILSLFILRLLSREEFTFIVGLQKYFSLVKWEKRKNVIVNIFRIPYFRRFIWKYEACIDLNQKVQQYFQAELLKFKL